MCGGRLLCAPLSPREQAEGWLGGSLRSPRGTLALQVTSPLHCPRGSHASPSSPEPPCLLPEPQAGGRRGPALNEEPACSLLTQILPCRGPVLTPPTPLTDEETASWTRVHPPRAVPESRLLGDVYGSQRPFPSISAETCPWAPEVGTTEQRPHCPLRDPDREGDAGGEGKRSWGWSPLSTFSGARLCGGRVGACFPLSTPVL